MEKRKEKIEKQKITILVIMGAMTVSVWDLFVQAFFEQYTFLKVTKFLAIFISFSFITLVVARFFTETLYLYEENFYIKNNTAIIENLIYLNEFIIQEEEERGRNGRRG